MKVIPDNLKKNPRYQAIVALERIEKGSYSNLLLNEMIKKSHFKPEDVAFFTELVYGTLSRKITLEYQLSHYLKNPKKVLNWVKILLETALFQMMYLDRVPNHAILNESVEIAKQVGHQGIANLVNGVLRQFQRKGPVSLDTIEDPVKFLSISGSIPEELSAYLIETLGFEKASALGESILSTPKVSARVNTNKLSLKEALAVLETEGITAVPSVLTEDGIVGEKGHLAGSSLFENGRLTIQDESSMLVAPNMSIEPGDLVLDACAAPGGKTTHIAQYLNEGKVIALDLHPHKVNLIIENARRLGVRSKVEAKAMDAREVLRYYAKETFDKILVDAPCSGLGLMRRKPDIKYQKSPASFERLPEIQLDILNHVAQTLKVGGILFYSTCTINPKENEEVVNTFLKEHPEFVLDPLPKAPKDKAENLVTIYPQDFNSDGFFLSRMKKISSTHES